MRSGSTAPPRNAKPIIPTHTFSMDQLPPSISRAHFLETADYSDFTDMGGAAVRIDVRGVI
jgi:hypothetical protein